MSANIPETMLVSDLLKATGYNCPDNLKDSTFDEATSGDSSVELENNKTVSITENGTVEITPSEGKDAMKKVTATVNVPSSITTEALSVTENGTYTAPSGKAYSPVTVNVPSTIIEQTKSVTITENGTTTVAPDPGKLLSSVTITTNVSGSGGSETYYKYSCPICTECPVMYLTYATLPADFADKSTSDVKVLLPYASNTFVPSTIYNAFAETPDISEAGSNYFEIFVDGTTWVFERDTSVRTIPSGYVVVEQNGDSDGTIFNTIRCLGDATLDSGAIPIGTYDAFFTTDDVYPNEDHDFSDIPNLFQDPNLVSVTAKPMENSLSGYSVTFTGTTEPKNSGNYGTLGRSAILTLLISN